MLFRQDLRICGGNNLLERFGATGEENLITFSMRLFFKGFKTEACRYQASVIFPNSQHLNYEIFTRV